MEAYITGAGIIAPGTTLDFDVRGQTEASQFQIVFTPAMLRGEATSILNETLSVVDVDVQSSDTIITGTLAWSYTARVRVTTRVAYGSAGDVGSIIANAFYRASGSMPTVNQGSGLPRLPGLPQFSWTTAVVFGAVAVLVLAWKF